MLFAVGCRRVVRFWKNGIDFGEAFRLPADVERVAPGVCLGCSDLARASTVSAAIVPPREALFRRKL